MKLSEEVGELSRALRRRIPAVARPDQRSGGEGIWDMMYDTLAVANACDIDAEARIPVKEALINARYPIGPDFRPDRCSPRNR